MDHAMDGVWKVMRCEKQWFREFLAEMVGTMFLVCLGNGAIAQVILSRGETGTFTTINMAMGLAVAFGIYISAGVSGGHINPAITLAMCMLGKLPARKIFVYWSGQFIGAFLGAILVYAAYIRAIDDFDGGLRAVHGPNATAGIFSTYPAHFTTTGSCLYDQILGTAVLASFIFAVTDQRNCDVPKYLAPLLIGITVSLIGMAYGLNCGFPINPARDLAPRFFTFIAGWGTEVFSYNDYTWFWIPVIAPCIGAVLGAFLYQLTIGMHWPASQYDLDLSERGIIKCPMDVDTTCIKATKFSFPEGTYDLSVQKY